MSPSILASLLSKTEIEVLLQILVMRMSTKKISRRYKVTKEKQEILIQKVERKAMYLKRKFYSKSCSLPTLSILDDLQKPVWRIYLNEKIANGYNSQMIADELGLSLEEVNKMF